MLFNFILGLTYNEVQCGVGRLYTLSFKQRTPNTVSLLMSTLVNDGYQQAPLTCKVILC